MTIQFLKGKFVNFLLLVILANLFIFPVSSRDVDAAQSQRAKLNVVIFLSDDQSKVDYGIYGNEKVNTPVIDKLAGESLLFSHAFTPQAICAPSRAALYSGKYPIRNGLFINHTSYREGTKFIPDYLKPLGYETVLAGKQHIKPKNTIPWTHVFRSVAAEENAAHEDKTVPNSIPFEKIKNYLENIGDQPFVMVVASSLPHGPYPEKTKYKPGDVKTFPHQQGSSLRDYPGYYANIDRKEAEVAFVLETLDRTKLADDTIFIYTSDHGNSTRAKFTVYDQGLNVPLLVRWPGVTEPGQSGALVSFVDFVPTLVEIAGGTLFNEVVDGKSFLPLLKGQANEHHDAVYGVMTNQGIWEAHVFPQRSIREHRYHYIYNFNSFEKITALKKSGKKVDPFLLRGAKRHKDQPEEELYDTHADPYELNNLAANPDYAETKDRMKIKLGQWMKSQNDFLSFEHPTTPFFKTVHPLDEPNKHLKVPQSLRNTIDNYINPHDAQPAGLEDGG